MFDGLINVLITAAIIVVGLFVIGMILSRLYRRASKEVSFVRTGFTRSRYPGFFSSRT
jgi:uncharacterized membrane protein YqiK